MDKQYRKKRQPAYRNEKKTEKKVKRSKHTLLGILMFIVLVWAFLGFIRSDFFILDEIVVLGNIHTQEAEIRGALPVQVGDNIWQLNTAHLEDRLAEIPRIEAATVTRSLPRKLVVEIAEKRTLALVPYQQYLLEIGTDGMVLGSTQDSQNYGRPLLTGLMPRELTVGKQLLDGSLLHETVAAISAMDQAGVAVSELNLAEETNLVLVTMDGLTVWLGLDQYERKAELLVQIMAQLGGRQAEGYLDLRVAAAPAFHVIEEEDSTKKQLD